MTKKTLILTPEQRLARLLRIRWAARGVLALGVAASVVANVLHAEDNPISQSIAAWPPLALLITVEFILPIPVHRRWLANIRLIGTALIAGIAAWVSYWHMVGVVLRYGESADVAYLLPLSVDGLVVVASVSLVELSGHIRSLTTTLSTPMPTGSGPAAAPDPFSTATAPGARTELVPEEPAATQPKTTATPAPRTAADGAPPSPSPAFPVPQDPAVRAEPAPKPGKALGTGPAASHEGQNVVDEQPPSDTAGAVVYWHRRDPTLSIPEVAEKIGKSSRTVRRYWPSTTGVPPATTATANRLP